MFNILFFLQRIVLVPYSLLTAPFRTVNENLTESGRSRALMLGLPALIFAAVGVSAVAWAEFVSKDNLEDKYKVWAEDCDREKLKLIQELNTEQRLNQQAQTAEDKPMVVSLEDERVIKLIELQESETIFLEKLISLNPKNADYRFNLAIVAAQRGDIGRCRSLMESIAGNEDPGNPKAHLWRARDFLKQPVQSPNDLRRNMAAALQQADLCLVREAGNLDARLIRAQLLSAHGRHREALEEYKELFVEYPRFYKQIVQLNEILGMQEESLRYIETAESKFLQQINESKINYDPSWSHDWTNYIDCLHFRKDYQLAAEKLAEEEQIQSQLSKNKDDPTAASRHVFIKQLLTYTYTTWADKLGRAADLSLDKQRQQLDLLKKALSYNLQYADALKLVARISTGDSNLASEAREIYDPEKFGSNAPAAVLNEIGSRALMAKEYDKAIKYFEWAREKSPDNPQVLNNLAWTYLVCENENPDRALSLVNKAIGTLSQVSDRDMQKELASHFFDTQGRAYLQMGRKTNAAAAFERALEWRKDNADIIRSLIQCYEGNDALQVQVLEERLAEILAREENGEAGNELPPTIEQ